LITSCIPPLRRRIVRGHRKMFCWAAKSLRRGRPRASLNIGEAWFSARCIQAATLRVRKRKAARSGIFARSPRGTPAPRGHQIINGPGPGGPFSPFQKRHRLAGRPQGIIHTGTRRAPTRLMRSRKWYQAGTHTAGQACHSEIFVQSPDHFSFRLRLPLSTGGGLRDRAAGCGLQQAAQPTGASNPFRLL